MGIESVSVSWVLQSLAHDLLVRKKIFYTDVLHKCDKGLLALAPPHQGIDGEWSDGSGVIVYKWNDKTDRPNTGRSNWKKRWSCCAEFGENAPPCRQGWHVSYDDGFTLY
ncbi:hypothetical protein Tco_0587766 [Tanacetum coccineum]